MSVLSSSGVKNGRYMRHYQKDMYRSCGRSSNGKTDHLRIFQDGCEGGGFTWAGELQKNKSINKIS